MTRMAENETAPDLALKITRVFDAPRALVYRMWTEKHLMSRWSCPEGFTIPSSDADVRVGGHWRAHMRSPAGEDYRLQGIYREIVPGERLVFTHAWLDEAGRPGPETLVTVSLMEERGKTRMDFIQTGFESVSSRNGHEDGWLECMQKFEALLDAVKASDHTIITTRVLNAPVARAFACFSDPVNISHWWGPNGFSTTTYEMEFRVGGVWRYTMHGPDGTDYPNHVSYTEIIPSQRIAYDHGTNAQHPDIFKALITFAAEGDKCRITLQLTVPDPKHRNEMINFGAVEGAWQTLSRLDDYLASSARETAS